MNTETYTFRPTNYTGYTIRAAWSPEATEVVVTAPNGTVSGVLPTVADGENWMVAHFNTAARRA